MAAPSGNFQASPAPNPKLLEDHANVSLAAGKTRRKTSLRQPSAVVCNPSEPGTGKTCHNPPRPFSTFSVLCGASSSVSSNNTIDCGFCDPLCYEMLVLIILLKNCTTLILSNSRSPTILRKNLAKTKF